MRPEELAKEIVANMQKNAGKPGLWANIHAKRKRGEKPASPGDKDYPDSKNWKKVTEESEKQAAPAWQTAEGKSESGGLNDKGRASLKAQGHDIKRPQPEGGPRKDSFCARMKGMKAKLTSEETARDPDSRINKSLRKWKCGSAVEKLAFVMKQARCWEGYEAVPGKKPYSEDSCRPVGSAANTKKKDKKMPIKESAEKAASLKHQLLRALVHTKNAPRNLGRWISEAPDGSIRAKVLDTAMHPAVALPALAVGGTAALGTAALPVAMALDAMIPDNMHYKPNFNSVSSAPPVAPVSPAQPNSGISPALMAALGLGGVATGAIGAKALSGKSKKDKKPTTTEKKANALTRLLARIRPHLPTKRQALIGAGTTAGVGGGLYLGSKALDAARQKVHSLMDSGANAASGLFEEFKNIKNKAVDSVKDLADSGTKSWSMDPALANAIVGGGGGALLGAGYGALTHGQEADKRKEDRKSMLSRMLSYGGLGALGGAGLGAGTTEGIRYLASRPGNDSDDFISRSAKDLINNMSRKQQFGLMNVGGSGLVDNPLTNFVQGLGNSAGLSY